jgi:hypothetical protein
LWVGGLLNLSRISYEAQESTLTRKQVYIEQCPIEGKERKPTTDQNSITKYILELSSPRLILKAPSSTIDP